MTPTVFARLSNSRDEIEMNEKRNKRWKGQIRKKKNSIKFFLKKNLGNGPLRGPIRLIGDPATESLINFRAILTFQISVLLIDLEDVKFYL